MTLRQWIEHLSSWLHSFPLRRDTDHCWVGLVGGAYEDCLVCGAHRANDEADDEGV